LSVFERALCENTGLLLRCHPSNFKIVGFSEEVSGGDLAELGKRHGIPVMDDLGSGAIIDTGALGAGPTTTLRAAVESGCDVVTASGDKLLGGPQCGIVVGRKDLIQQIGSHPLARALRVDKLTLAALEATLRLYREPERAVSSIPTLRYLGRGLTELRALAEKLRLAIGDLQEATVELVESQSQVGGGSLPGENLPTVCARITTPGGGKAVERISRNLRLGDPPVIGRIRDGSVYLDPRTLEPEEITVVAEAVRKAVIE
jgi:L-seryl-tRNA(Ser) seleniumtransferase